VDQGFAAASSEAMDMIAAFCWRQSRGCYGVRAATAAQGCPAEQRLPQRAVCWGMTLPPARVSTQPAQGAPHNTAAEGVGRRIDPWLGRAGQGPSAVRRALHVSGLLTAPDHPSMFPRALFQKHIKTGATLEQRCFPASLLSLSC